MRRSKRFVPVDTGTLKSSGQVTTRPVRIGSDLVVVAYYGGAAADYAERQHEVLYYRHRVGGPKYLARAVAALLPVYPEWVTQELDKAIRGTW